MKKLKLLQILFAILILSIITIGRMIKNPEGPGKTTLYMNKKKEASCKEIVELANAVRYNNKILLK